jgi:DNA-binding SARP family transcriptional activator
VRDETGRPVHVGGRQLRVLLTLLALNAGRVVPAGSLAGEIWPDDLPGNPGNALQTLVSRLRAQLRQAGIGDVIESHPAGNRLADAAGCEFADAVAAKLTELRSSALADRIEADLALGEGASLVGELRVLLSADPLAASAPMSSRPPMSAVVPSPRTTRSPSPPARWRIP